MPWLSSGAARWIKRPGLTKYKHAQNKVACCLSRRIDSLKPARINGAWKQQPDALARGQYRG